MFWIFHQPNGFECQNIPIEWLQHDRCNSKQLTKLAKNQFNNYNVTDRTHVPRRPCFQFQNVLPPSPLQNTHDILFHWRRRKNIDNPITPVNIHVQQFCHSAPSCFKYILDQPAMIQIEHFTQMGNLMMWEHSDCEAFLIEEVDVWRQWKMWYRRPTN